MKRIKKEMIPANLRNDDGRKTADINALLSDLSELKRQAAQEKIHFDAAEKLIRRPGFNAWIEAQKARAKSGNDKKRVDYMMERINRNPDYAADIVFNFTIYDERAPRCLVFDFDAVTRDMVKRG